MFLKCIQNDLFISIEFEYNVKMDYSDFSWMIFPLLPNHLFSNSVLHLFIIKTANCFNSHSFDDKIMKKLSFLAIFFSVIFVTNMLHITNVFWNLIIRETIKYPIIININSFWSYLVSLTSFLFDPCGRIHVTHMSCVSL